MEIEQGDYFVVTRGVRLNTSACNLFGQIESWKTNESDDEPRYDRSFHNIVFRAEQVCGQMVAARVISGRRLDWPPPVCQLNLYEVEVMTVTQAYVNALNVPVPAEGKPAGTEQE